MWVESKFEKGDGYQMEKEGMGKNSRETEEENIGPKELKKK